MREKEGSGQRTGKDKEEERVAREEEGEGEIEKEREREWKGSERKHVVERESGWMQETRERNHHTMTASKARAKIIYRFDFGQKMIPYAIFDASPSRIYKIIE